MERQADGKKESLKEDIKDLDKKIKEQNKAVDKEIKDYEIIKEKIKNSKLDYNDEEIDKLIELSKKQEQKTEKLKEELEKIKEGDPDEKDVDTDYFNSILNNS